MKTSKAGWTYSRFQEAGGQGPTGFGQCVLSVKDIADQKVLTNQPFWRLPLRLVEGLLKQSLSSTES